MANNKTNTKREKILIVDDEENMRRTLADILVDEGYDVTTAGTGEEAVELCEEGDHKVILMDVRMPGIGGVEAFRKIRRHHEGIRVILMSAFSVDALKEAALDEGAIAFLAKPLNLEKVIDLVDEVKETAILVVEDDEKTAELLSENLKEDGYRVTTAKTAHDALELVEQIRFDLVFLDANLPSMNGLELYLAIKKITPTAVAIMICSAKRIHHRAQASGYRSYPGHVRTNHSQTNIRRSPKASYAGLAIDCARSLGERK